MLHKSRLLLTDRVCRQTTISNLMKMVKSSEKGLKTVWEKETLLITVNFSFSHSVFKRLGLRHVGGGENHTHTNVSAFIQQLEMKNSKEFSKDTRP